jgi:hypothetical protein
MADIRGVYVLCGLGPITRRLRYVPRRRWVVLNLTGRASHPWSRNLLHVRAARWDMDKSGVGDWVCCRSRGRSGPHAARIGERGRGCLGAIEQVREGRARHVAWGG